MSNLRGRCLCGAVKFEAESAETRHHACHCAMCRRWAGSALLVTACAGVRFEGEEHLARYDSSPWAQRGFCKRCGTHLFYFLRPGGQYSLCVGAFDDDSPFRLAEEIFVDQQPPGYRFAGELRRLTRAEVLAAHGVAPDAID